MSDGPRHHHHVQVEEVIIWHSEDSEPGYVFVGHEMDDEPCTCGIVTDPFTDTSPTEVDVEKLDEVVERLRGEE